MTAPSTVAADFGTRFSAFMIDAVLLGAVQWVVFFVLSRQLQAVGLSAQEPCSADANLTCQGPSTTVWALLIVALLASTIGYHALFEGLRGATPGKHRMGLVVTGIDGAGPIGLQRGLVRAIVRQLFWLSLFIVLDVSPLSLPVGPELFVLIPALGLAALAVGAVAPSGRAAHDWAASTVVVHAPGGTPSTSDWQWSRAGSARSMSEPR